jgi:acetyl esterase/lipase
MSSDKKVYQSIHPSVRGRLDPEYVRFHEEFLQFIKPSEEEPWDPAARYKPSPTTHGAQRVATVGSTVDHDTGTFQVRVFTPEGVAPIGGWPTLVWYHGGGFVMGGLGSENGFLTHICHCLS